MKPKPSKSNEAAMKIVRFAATPSLVDQDLSSLLEICNKSVFHSGNWNVPSSKSSRKKAEIVANCADENIYAELRQRGLKIQNQR